MNKVNKIIESFPLELKFLLVCSGSDRWGSAELSSKVDWEVFLQWMKRHRVGPAVYRFIKQNPGVLPEKVENRVMQMQQKITKKALLLTGELIRIGKILDENNIPWFTMKGPVLAMQLYGDVAGRDYRDLDIFIEEKNLSEAISVLQNSGLLNKSRYRINQLKMVSHHCELINPEKKIKIELHYRLFFNQAISGLLYENFIRNTEKFSINGQNVNIPKDKEGFGFIVEHAGIHGYSDLQWLIDSIMIFEKRIPFYNSCYVDFGNALYDLLFSNNQSEINNSRLLYPLKLISLSETNLRKKLLVIIWRWKTKNNYSFKYKVFAQPILRRWFWIVNRF